MIALHLSEMEALSVEDSEMWITLGSGLWSPNKKGLNFYSLGTDEALEQENIKLKVTGISCWYFVETRDIDRVFSGCTLLCKDSGKCSQVP